MSSVARKPAYRALLSLERSSAPPTELFDEVARIIGISFTETSHDLFKESEDISSRKPVIFAPKEEWALRWLLKKTKSPEKATSHASEAASSANGDPRKWLLFYHLVSRTPVRQVAKILREQEGIRQIQNALDRLVLDLKTLEASKSVSATDSGSASTLGYEFEAVRGINKKRKRSPIAVENEDQGTQALQIYLSILRSLSVCLKDALVPSSEDSVAQQHMRMALSLKPAVAARILKNLFQISELISGEHSNRPAFQRPILHHLLDSLQLWEFRHGPDLDSTKEDADRAFTSLLLVPCLSVLKLIRYWGIRTQHRPFEIAMERLVALHAVQPARDLFFDELATEWQSNRDPLLLEHVKSATDRLQTVLEFASNAQSPLVDSNQVDAGDCDQSIYQELPILLEIAIRMCQKSNVRQLQHEKPWFEALFVCLAHVGGCPLANGASTSRQPENAQLDCLEFLLRTLIHWKASLSLPLLSSIVQHFAGLEEDQQIQLHLVSAIMRLDVNVFIPNSGIANTKEHLKKLIDKLDANADLAPRDPSSVAEDRHPNLHVLSSLMDGFAYGRDLGTFVEIWMSRLSRVEQSRLSYHGSARSNPETYNLWDDEATVAVFAEVARKSALPSFIESHLVRTMQSLGDVKYKVEHYAMLVVLDVLIKVHAEEIASLDESVVPLRREIEDAILNDKARGKQLGLLWRLQRQLILLPGANKALSNIENETPIIEAAMRTAIEDPDYFRSMQAFSDVEKFHCFVVMAALQAPAENYQMNREISSLAKTISTLRNQDITGGLVEANLWNGRASSLMSRADLVMAFLGILSQTSAVLCMNLEATIELVKGMFPLITGDGAAKNGWKPKIPCLVRAIILDEGLLSTPGYIRKFLKATGIIDKNEVDETILKLVQYLPKEGMTKLQKKQLALWEHEKRIASQKATDDPDTQTGFPAAQANLSTHVVGPTMTRHDLERSCQLVQESRSLQTREKDAVILERMREQEPLIPGTLLLVGSMLTKGDISPAQVVELATDLSTLLPKSQSLDSFCLTADCIKTILDKHHASVNQWTIDNLLACITIAVSIRGPDIPNSPSIVFDRLCRLLGAILSQYRIRLGGRFHLLLPPFRSLLHCLFAPSDPHSLITTPSQALFYSNLPPWLRNANSTSTSPCQLTKPSATHLTRLFSSICNPTPTAVKRNSHSLSNQLNDPTKKARRIAGQHMHQLITEYSHCQLNGRIAPEVKDALLPGLYTILDAMDAEGMRAMNAGMHASARAVFKILYDDWRRFGKWDGV